MITLGQKITASRRQKGWTLADLSLAVNMSISGIRKVETDRVKNPDPELIIRIAEVLEDRSILLHALKVNPIYREVIPQVFSDLNHIKSDPSAIFEKLLEELEEAREAAKILARIFTHADPASTPNFRDVFLANMEQIVDVLRGGETLFLKLIDAGLMNEEDRREVHARQQAKCERNGHHKPVRGGTEA